jgi:hypothetical protein
VMTFVQPFKISLPHEILKQLNHSIIALVPKSANANFVADYRPIS